jgi:HEAT repeat protein
MSRNKPPSDRRLILAAELRVGGSTWDAVAARLHRSPETVRKWPIEYPDRWKQAVHEAERRLATEAEGEAVLLLRQLLRSKDQKIVWHAAKHLLHLRLELARLDLRAAALAGTTTSDAPRLLVTLLEGHSDEHLARLVATECERTAGLHPLLAGTPAGGPP